MKNLVLSLLGLTFLSPAWSQVSKKSNSLSFNSSDKKTAISNVSNLLKFESGAHPTSISALSETLSFGGSPDVNQKQEDVKVAVAKPNQTTTPPPVNKEESPRQGNISQGTAQSSSVSSNPPLAPVLVSNDSPQPTRSLPIAAPTTPVKSAAQLGEEFTMSIPRYVALVIGISKYKYAGDGGPRSLENAANDAEKLYKTLTTKYNFDTTVSRLMKDPTRGQIVDAFDRLTAETNEKDNVLVFYAGHGNYDTHTEFGYWLPADSKTTTKSAWIANSTIKDYMGAIKSKHTLLITDACFGGSIFKSRSVDAATFLKIHDLYKDPSRRAMTSGNLSEVPDKSFFIDQLLKKLNENELDYLPSARLYNLIYQPVADNATEPQFGVIQGAGDEGGDFIFIKQN